MPNAPLVKIKAATAAEVCTTFTLDAEALPLLKNGMPPRDFLEALLAQKQYVAAIDFLAHALAPRDSIWWGCLCLQHALGSTLSDADKAACKAAVRWILAPTEENRATAGAPAEVAGPATPSGGLASAAFRTGGSIAPPKYPPIPPKPFAPAKAVSLSVKLSSTKAEPARISETKKLYVEMGMALAEGRFSHTDIRGVAPIRGVTAIRTNP